MTTAAPVRDQVKTLLDQGFSAAETARRLEVSRARVSQIAGGMPRSTMTPKQLLDMRLSLGFSQQELAVKLEVGIASISRWERGVCSAPGWFETRLRYLARQYKKAT